MGKEPTINNSNTGTQNVNEDDNDAEASKLQKTNTKMELSETQNILVSAATKYALLCGLTILFICLQFGATAIYNLTQTVNYDIQLVLELWFVLVLFSEYFSIYWSFPISMHQYQVVCS